MLKGGIELKDTTPWLYCWSLYLNCDQLVRGGSRISGKGVHMYKGVGVRLADFISFF